MVDWNKPLEAVEKATGRVVPVTFGSKNDTYGETMYRTNETPNSMNTNNSWYEDGRDWCSRDAWFVRNREKVENPLHAALARAMSPDGGDFYNEALYASAKRGWLDFFVTLAEIRDGLPSEEERDAFDNALADTF